MFAALRKSTRGKSFLAFFATSIASRAVGIACQLLQVPIAIGAMGSEAFGLWMTLSSISYMITFADFGMGVGVQNRLAEAFAVKQLDAARQLFGSAFLFLLCVATVLAAVLLPLAWLLNLPVIFGLTDHSIKAEAPQAVAAILATFCVGFPFGLAQRLAYSQQLGWKHNVSQACGNVVAVAALYLASRLHFGIGAMILCAAAPAVLANVCLIVHLLKRLDWLHLRGFRPDFATVRELLGLGMYFTVQQILNLSLFALPQIVISTSLGAAAVTPFNLAQRFFNLFGVLQNAFMLPLWPAYSQAKATGEFQWIRATLQRSLLATTFLTILPMALGAFLAKPIILLWVKSAAAVPSTTLIWLMFLWNASVFLQQPFGFLLAGVSRVQRMTYYSVLAAVCSAGLMVLLVRWYAQDGVLLGMLIGSVPITFVCNVMETVLYLRTVGHPSPVTKPEKTALVSPEP